MQWLQPRKRFLLGLHLPLHPRPRLRTMPLPSVIIHDISYPKSHYFPLPAQIVAKLERGSLPHALLYVGTTPVQRTHQRVPLHSKLSPKVQLSDVAQKRVRELEPNLSVCRHFWIRVYFTEIRNYFVGKEQFAQILVRVDEEVQIDWAELYCDYFQKLVDCVLLIVLNFHQSRKTLSADISDSLQQGGSIQLTK